MSCRRFGIARLDVFGSFSRREDALGNGVGLLYEPVQGRLFGCKIENL